MNEAEQLAMGRNALRRMVERVEKAEEIARHDIIGAWDEVVNAAQEARCVLDDIELEAARPSRARHRSRGVG